jgi:hypothetical protein
VGDVEISINGEDVSLAGSTLRAKVSKRCADDYCVAAQSDALAVAVTHGEDGRGSDLSATSQRPIIAGAQQYRSASV